MTTGRYKDSTETSAKTDIGDLGPRETREGAEIKDERKLPRKRL
jgi:hypothetical protein